MNIILFFLGKASLSVFDRVQQVNGTRNSTDGVCGNSRELGGGDTNKLSFYIIQHTRSTQKDTFLIRQPKVICLHYVKVPSISLRGDGTTSRLQDFIEGFVLKRAKSTVRK